MKRSDDNEPLTKGEFREHISEFRELKEDVGGLKKDVSGLKKDFRDLKEVVFRNGKKLDTTITIMNMRFDDIESKMIPREEWNVHMMLMDEMITEVRDAREERLLFAKQRLRTDDIVTDHEKRIKVLEKAA